MAGMGETYVDENGNQIFVQQDTGYNDWAIMKRTREGDLFYYELAPYHSREAAQKHLDEIALRNGRKRGAG